MLVRRKIWFYHNNLLCYREVRVEWPDEYTINSVRDCLSELHSKVGKSLSPCLDVSTVSVGLGRRYALKNTKTLTEGGNYDTWQKGMQTMMDVGVEEFIAYSYLRALSDFQREYLRGVRSFTDINWGPKTHGISAAQCCVLYQLLGIQKKLDYLQDWNKFAWWCFSTRYFESRIRFKNDIEKHTPRPELPKPEYIPTSGWQYYDLGGL